MRIHKPVGKDSVSYMNRRPRLSTAVERQLEEVLRLKVRYHQAENKNRAIVKGIKGTKPLLLSLYTLIENMCEL